MFLKYSMWINILKDIEQCKQLAHFIIININSHTTHVSVFSACWLKERDCLYCKFANCFIMQSVLCLCTYLYQLEMSDMYEGIPKSFWTELITKIYADLCCLCSPPPQSISLLNLCNMSSVSTTAGSTPESDFFERSIEQSITLPEFQGSHVHNGLIATISFLETNSQRAKPGGQGSWETTAMSLTDKNSCIDKAQCASRSPRRITSPILQSLPTFWENCVLSHCKTSL